mgnify:CR=1 FL=1
MESLLEELMDWIEDLLISGIMTNLTNAFDAVNQDKFFKTDYGFEEIYFNPDADSGGQLVYSEYPFDLMG